MDTSDPDIIFDNKGICDHCIGFEQNIKPNWHIGAQAEEELAALSSDIRRDNGSSNFDCIIGVSGGLDSSYAAYVAVEKMGLRPLLFHVDAGWNTNQAVENIEKLVDGLGVDLYTQVVDWEEVKQLQLAFLRSAIPDQDLVQDAAFFGALYKFARQHRIKHIITGSNFSTECCREPEQWGGYLGIDTRLFGDIWRKFGTGKLKTFPIVDTFITKIWYQKILKMKVHYPLNLIAYDKVKAEEELYKKFGWNKFQHKHHKSRFTRFYEDYWLVRRFGYEKRRAHFSSLIMTGQMGRNEALERISKPEFSEHFLKQEFEYISKKLDISELELKELFDMPKKTYSDYKNKRWLIAAGTKLLSWLGLENRNFR